MSPAYLTRRLRATMHRPPPLRSFGTNNGGACVVVATHDARQVERALYDLGLPPRLNEVALGQTYFYVGGRDGPAT